LTIVTLCSSTCQLTVGTTRELNSFNHGTQLRPVIKIDLMPGKH